MSHAAFRVPARARSRVVSIVVVAVATMTSASRGGDVTTRVSVDSSGQQSEWGAGSPSISDDGRFVAFESSSDLAPGGGQGRRNIYVHDRQTGQTVCASVDSSGVGRDEDSWAPALAGNGSAVAFYSLGDFVPGTGTWLSVFVHDLKTGETTAASVSSSGAIANRSSEHPSISGDGRYVTYDSLASNLVSSDQNNSWDVFVHDRWTGETVRASVDSSGLERVDDSKYPSISTDGRSIAFESWAEFVAPDPRYWDIFVHDMQTGETSRVSVTSAGGSGNHNSNDAAISGDGRFVTFESTASNLVPDDTNGLIDVFLHDRLTATTTRVSVDSSGAQANGYSQDPSIGRDGRYVAFESTAALVAGDTNGFTDVFVHDAITGQTIRASVATNGDQGNSYSSGGAISADARFVAFWSLADNLVSGDTNGAGDVFVRGRELTLETSAPVVSGGQTLSLTTYRGVPGNPASLWVTAVNGTPAFRLIVLAGFAADGRFVVSGTVPGGWGSGAVTFRSYCVGAAGSIVATNDVTVTFQ
ncbi:MAG: calcium-binding protein [Planctomycetota bacterium]